MSDDLKDILSNDNKNIDNRQLMDYLNDQLSEANKHAVEKNMANDDFTNDAIEGLQEFTATKDISLFVEQLNKDLQKKTAKNKRRKEKRQWKDQPYTYIAIIIILLLLLTSYIIVRKYLGR
jgi:ABC-type transport system involved in cytochrome bd biosynthesis fused ATPase/permease subunit